MRRRSYLPSCTASLAAAALLCLAAVAPAQTLEPLPPDAAPGEATVFPGFSPGAWRNRSQLVWDAGQRRLIRAAFSFWDPLAAEGLDVTWVSDDGLYPPGPLSAEGRLSWRRPGAASYDASAAVAQYRGGFAEGRADGTGEFLHRSGASYRGQWRAGLMHGQGRLQLPDGDEYVGGFRDGRRHGRGVYVDRFGTVYEGGFAAGRRHGDGKVQLASGGAYAARWLDGTEIAGSRKTLPGAGGALLPVQDAADVRLALSVDRRPVLGIAGFQPLFYVGENTPGALRIFPDDPLLLAVWRGEERIRSNDEVSFESYNTNFMGPEIRYRPLPLILSVENAAGSAIGVAGAYLEVTRSVTEPRPALQLGYEVGNQCGAYFDSGFSIDNFGWTPARSAVAAMTFVDSAGRAVGATFDMPVGDIAHNAAVELRAELARRGAKVDRLETEPLLCSSTNEGRCLAEQVRSGVFGALGPAVRLSGGAFMVDLEGTLRYEWTAADGSPQPGKADFTNTLTIGYLPAEVECGEGSDEGELGVKPFDFRLDAAGYRIPLPLVEDIPAGVTARWRLQLDAPKSSSHDFRLVVQLSDGRTVSTRPVNLLYFKPRSIWVDFDGNPWPPDAGATGEGEDTD